MTSCSWQGVAVWTGSVLECTFRTIFFWEVGGERWGEDSDGVPPSLPHSEYFFYDSLEIVMKGRPGGEKQLFAQNSIQRPGFCCLDGGFWRNIVCNARREQLKITKVSSCHITVVDYWVLWNASYNPYLQEVNLVLRYDNFSDAIPSKHLTYLISNGFFLFAFWSRQLALATEWLNVPWKRFLHMW